MHISLYIVSLSNSSHVLAMTLYCYEFAGPIVGYIIDINYTLKMSFISLKSGLLTP